MIMNMAKDTIVVHTIVADIAAEAVADTNKEEKRMLEQLKKEVYEIYGLYKTDSRISADYEFMIRILKDHKVKLSYIPEVLIKMAHGGTSTNSLGAYLEGLKEGHRALKENGVKFAFVTDMLRVLRVLKQFI